MNYWDTLPSDIQSYIHKISLAMLVEKNWMASRCFRAKSIATDLMSEPYGIRIICPVTADNLEFCAQYSGKKSTFWVTFSMKVLDALIMDMWSTDMGHGWIDRCTDAHETLIKKYNIQANKLDSSLLGKLSQDYYKDGSLMTMENLQLPW